MVLPAMMINLRQISKQNTRPLFRVFQILTGKTVVNNYTAFYTQYRFLWLTKKIRNTLNIHKIMFSSR